MPNSTSIGPTTFSNRNFSRIVYRRPARRARRVQPGQEPDGRHDRECDEYAGNDAADQQLADVHLGEQAVDHQRDAGGISIASVPEIATTPAAIFGS